jgi:hypothetical protein
MNVSPSLLSRRAARSVAALGSLVALTAALPARAQQERPVVRHSHPVVRLDRRNTRVTLEFTVPRGFQLADRPWIRIVEANGRPFLGTRPMFEQREPSWRASIDLNTEDFPAGAYRLRAEVEFVNPEGKREMIPSAWAPFVVPERGR